MLAFTSWNPSSLSLARLAIDFCRIKSDHHSAAIRINLYPPSFVFAGSPLHRIIIKCAILPARLLLTKREASMAMRIYTGCQENINLGKSNVSLRLCYPGLRLCFHVYMKSVIKAVGLLAKALCNSDKYYDTILHYSCSRVPIGMAAFSTAIRRSNHAAGQIQKLPPLLIFLCILDAFCCFYFACSLGKDRRANAFMLSHDPYYNDRIYLAVFSIFSFSILTPFSQEARISVLPRPWPYPSLHSIVRRHRAGHHARGNKKEDVDSYFLQRFNCPQLLMSYMLNGSNPSHSYTVHLQYIESSLPSGKIIPTVFLHSFSDALYPYGLDGFLDLYQWTQFTLKALLGNPRVYKILVKEHPAIDYNYRPADKRALENLKKEFANNSLVHWINEPCSIEELCSLRGFIGITHHGSIAEEISYFGKTVISSICSPWGSSYSFAVTWSNPNQYWELLHNLEELAFPEKAEVDFRILELYDYISDYRLSPGELERKNYDLSLLSIAGASQDRSIHDRINHINSMFDETGWSLLLPIMISEGIAGSNKVM